ncbi:MAG: hypothetical protein A2233_00905 [Candidatus Kerfeldbacteria bacterium RIFOXYA2_FULL_38_24]|uniref:SUF system FeS cluster assembly SufBD core domain-containing protein n=1 Tax=Candidatus Kerfeldbacteria bacterium RIFOXYB2_FULL_38_14 TaxID=1798547 RepID=A0A1G2BFW4_9BACT|nr:MAG: hypothetical protein A2233_00905 [Candidatus Kerfeldbacteria bacterium RIFOXYA2_FULL_38_24]OGY88113.1 MAG: hypothetical protein A2319_01635 [Candidatus Kerfeldbacteria bacterium RIFOXYB2_FULL_38_14]OGY88734.1 MAG: hypothetical protein A2458_03090 [Candidatus Kerfeldbacteria bacterium RIFOXYC2_FULL_38_9]
MKKIIIKKNTKRTLVNKNLLDAEIVVEKGANLHLINLPTKKTGRPVKINFHIQAGGVVRQFSALLHSIDLSVQVELLGDCSVFGHFMIYFGAHKEKIIFKSHTKHQGAQTMSRQFICGLAGQKSIADISAKIDISAQADKTDALLAHEGLLLGKQARINSLPGFSIHTNEVRAVHNSAIHYLKPQDLFYLQSRGLSLPQAQKLIISGFLKKLVSYIQEEPTRQETINLIDHKLNKIL